MLTNTLTRRDDLALRNWIGVEHDDATDTGVPVSVAILALVHNPSAASRIAGCCVHFCDSVPSGSEGEWSQLLRCLSVDLTPSRTRTSLTRMLLMSSCSTWRWIEKCAADYTSSRRYSRALSTAYGSETITSASKTPNMLRLEAAARLGLRDEFARLARAIAWEAASMEDLTACIDHALSLDLFGLARRLTETAKSLFPADPSVARLSEVFRPPKLTRAGPGRDLRASKRWIADNLSKFPGMWVAVRDGQLLGTAASLSQLRAIMADSPEDTVVAKAEPADV